MHKRLVAGLGLALLAHPVAALACENPRDVAALKTAALHQRLMVAALICKSNTAYNRFVLANRAELQRSDADLKAYFIAQGGEEGYDTYKTKVANLAARAPAIDTRAFCASTAQEFQSLSTGGLKQALMSERLPANICKAAPVLAAATKAKPATKVAAAEEVSGIGAARMPAMPYSAAPPPVARMVREAEPVDPADIVPPESYADSEPAVEPAEDDAPRRLAAAPERDQDYDDYAPRLAYAPDNRDERYDDYLPPAPRYARNARRGERYWYYRSLYARPRASWRD